MPDPVIVGIDPGTTTAIAFLDAEGNPIEVKSSRKYSKHKIIEEIRKKGSPLIIGTDKASLPSNVREITTKFHCKVNTPDEDLSRDKKSELVSEYTHLAGNEHEKDALASAIQAYKSYAKQLRKIKRRNKENYSEKVRKEFLDLASRETEKKPKEEKKPKKKPNENYRKQVKKLRKELEYLQSSLESKEEEINELKDRISRLKEREGITNKEALLESKIAKLKRRNKELKEKIKAFTEAYDEEEIKKIDGEEMKRRKITQDPETFQELKEKGEEAYLVDILLENEEEMYYMEIDHCEPSGNLVKDMVNRYQEKRRKN